jgi:hypothetical protein
MRWLHIYLSMFGLAATLFFSVTGLTVHHPGWFFPEAVREVSGEGKLPPALLEPDTRAGLRPAEPESGAAPPAKQVEIVEYLRRAHGLRGGAEFREDDFSAFFEGPGSTADVRIDRATGEYTVDQTFHGFTAILNDLHMGRGIGPAWSILIDVSAVLMVLIALTGLVLIFYLKLRRVPGVVVAVAGGLVVGLLYWFGVP